ILLWNTFDGFIPAHFVAPRPAGPSPWGGVPRYPRSHGPYPPAPLAAMGTLDIPAYLRAAPSFGAHRLRRLPAHTAIVVDSWAIDASGSAWYHGAVTPATAGAGPGWVWGDTLTLQRRAPTAGAAQ